MMKQRCLNPNNQSFSKYGGRGIVLDPRWESFTEFLADMGERPEGTSIDRIDNTKGYSKDNCRWATRKQQQRNRSANTVWTLDGVSRCVTEWAEVVGCKPHTLFERVNRHGWSIERALTTPPMNCGRRASQNS
jgi:hypothetical protein